LPAPRRRPRGAEDAGRTQVAQTDEEEAVMSNTLKIATPSDREIAMTRVFDAPRQLVFEAYTTPELLKRWLGVFGGWTLDVCEVDLRVGGAYRYEWNRSGKSMGLRGVFVDIVPN